MLRFILYCFTLTILATGCLGGILPNNGTDTDKHLKFYRLKNFGDDTYLEVATGYQTCEIMGTVITTSVLNPSLLNRWLFFDEGGSGYGYLVIDDESDKQYEYNEVTRFPKMVMCMTDYHHHVLVQTESHDKHVLSSSALGKCLTSNGNRNRISYTDCESRNPLQQWVFVPA